VAVLIISQFISSLGPLASSEAAVRALLTQQSELEEAAYRVFNVMNTVETSKAFVATSKPLQMNFDF
jgi:hypothetical protein